MSKYVKGSSKVISLLLCLILLAVMLPAGVLAVPVQPVFSGEGTAASPYLIQNKADLYELAERINDEDTSVAYADKHYRMTNDIDLDDVLIHAAEDDIDISGSGLNTNFMQIGRPSKNGDLYFKGVFDGAGYAIKNMSVNDIGIKSANIEPLRAYDQMSLFYELGSGGEIKNIFFTGIDVDLDDYYGRYAPVVTYIEAGATVSNITTQGNVAAEVVTGIAVENFGTIKNCTNNINIQAGEFASGIVAFNFGQVLDCSNQGEINAFNSAGIVLFNYGKISNCHNYGSLKGQMTTAGIAALISTGMQLVDFTDRDHTGKAIIVNCSNSGTISGIAISAGIAALAFNDTIIANSYNTGAILFVPPLEPGNISISVGKNSFSFGGIVAEVIESYYDIDGLGLADLEEDISVFTESDGRNAGSFELVNCYNTGTIDISWLEPYLDLADVYVGSLIGRSTPYLTIENSYYLAAGLDPVGAVMDLGLRSDLPEKEATMTGLATFTNNKGTLTAVFGHSIIEKETKLINALNTWVRKEAAGSTYKYWGASADVNGGYPYFNNSVAVSYNGNKGTVTVDSQNKRPGLTYGQSSTGASQALPKASRTGYNFAGWYTSAANANQAGTTGKVSDSMTITNSAKHTIFAGWTARNDTAYKVEHYLQETAGSNNYVLKETQNLKGTTAAAISASALTYEGYKENTSHTRRKASGTIAADGSLVLKLYYDRLVAPVNFSPKDTNTGIQVFGLENLVRLTPEELANASEIMIYLRVEELADDTINTQVRETARTSLATQGHDLLEVFDISIIKRIVGYDNSVWEGKVPNYDLLGKITVRIPVPEQHRGKENLAIAYIDDDGNIELFDTKLVIVDGIEYLEFETDHFSMYAIVQRDSMPLASDQTPKTGQTSRSPILPALLIAGGLATGIIRRKASKDKTESTVK